MTCKTKTTSVDGTKTSTERIATCRIACLSAVVAACTLVGPFQVYQNSVLANLYLPITAWLRSLRQPLGTNITATVSEDDERVVTFQFGVICAVPNVGCLVAQLMLMPFSRQLPRRSTLIAIACIASPAAIAGYLCRSWPLLVVTRLLTSVGFGIGSSVGALMVGEVAPLRYRGALLSAQSYASLLAAVLSMAVSTPYLLGTSHLWPYALALGPALSLLVLCVLPFVPESPRYLFLVRDDEAACRRSVEFYQGAANVERVMSELKSESMMAINQVGSSVISLLRQQGSLRVLAIASTIMATAGLTGDNILITNITFLLGFYEPCYRTAVVLATAVIASSVLPVLTAPLLIERIGRRPPLLFSTLTFTCCYIGLLFAGQLPPGVVRSTIGTIALLSCYWCRCIHYPARMTVTTEMFPQSLRLLGQCCARMASQTSHFVTQIIFLPLCQIIGINGVLALYVVGSFVSLALTWWLTPETRQKTFEQIYSESAGAPTRGQTTKPPLECIVPAVNDKVVNNVQPATV